jgi:hypothetical protein
MKTENPKFNGKKKYSQQLDMLISKLVKKFTHVKNTTSSDVTKSGSLNVNEHGILNTSNNTEEKINSKSSEIIKAEEYDMFTIVETDNGYFIALGNNRLSEFKESKQECKYLIDNKDWSLMFNVIITSCKAFINSELNKVENNV